MADLNLPLNYFANMVTKRLTRKLGKRGEVFPLRLWVYVAQVHARDGVLRAYTEDDVEEAAGWDGEPGLFVEEMIKVGWLALLDGEPGFRCVDWHIHQGHFFSIKENARRAARARWDQYEDGKDARREPGQPGEETKSVTARPGIAPGPTPAAEPSGASPPGENAVCGRICAGNAPTVPAIPTRPTNPYLQNLQEPTNGAVPALPAGPSGKASPAGPALPCGPGGLCPPQDGTAADTGRRDDGAETSARLRLEAGAGAGAPESKALRPPQDGTGKAADAGVASGAAVASMPVNGESLSGIRQDGQQGKEGDAGRRYVPPPSRKITETEERKLMARLRELLSDEEMDRRGGHWREDWVRAHPDILVWGIVELETAIRERPHRGQEPILNRAAWLEASLNEKKRIEKAKGKL